jgi:hypothetical protein
MNSPIRGFLTSFEFKPRFREISPVSEIKSPGRKNPSRA